MTDSTYAPSDTATLTPSKLLMDNSGVNEWNFNPSSINEFNTYISEINPFENSSMFEPKFNQPDNHMQILPPSPQYENNEQKIYSRAPPTPPTSNDSPPKKQRKKLLEKNREAAYRCRQKKKKWVNDLEERSESAEHRNKELQDQVSQLREESIYLRNLLLTHGNCDCDVVQTYLRRTSEQLMNNANNTSHVPALIGSTSSVSGSESSFNSSKQYMDATALQRQNFMI
ncbi:hypothetical protein INT48_009270 [Thamnidium elegans]|uniref:BZIP domain-containing protein n=1 Tax=Thamnidium elegans TaxID=101142 RepID=A0A8H7SMY3_9FUNG|nr:hypothetical protein INT48_009270 [Thamnidium elegans]